jgi:hypothetical protein
MARGERAERQELLPKTTELTAPPQPGQTIGEYCCPTFPSRSLQYAYRSSSPARLVSRVLAAYRLTNLCPELIDKCVGSQIWVIMNGGKGKRCYVLHLPTSNSPRQNLSGNCLASMTMSVSISSVHFAGWRHVLTCLDMVLTDVTEMYVNCQLVFRARIDE